MLCSVCKETIDGRYLTDEHGAVFCSNSCFNSKLPTCVICGDIMNQWIVSENGNKYCSEGCYEHHLPKCVTCNKPLRKWIETEKGDKYCDEMCYKKSQIKCFHCNSEVSRSYKDDYGNIYCSKLCIEEAVNVNSALTRKPSTDDSVLDENKVYLVPIMLRSNIDRNLIMKLLNEDQSNNPYKKITNRLIKGLELYEKDNLEIITRYDRLTKSIDFIEDNENSIVINEMKIINDRKDQLNDFLKHKFSILEVYLLDLFEGNKIKCQDELEQMISFLERSIQHNDFLKLTIKKNECLVDLDRKWTQQFKYFKKDILVEYKESCSTEKIDCEIVQIWIDEWCKKKLSIEYNLKDLVNKEIISLMDMDMLLRIDLLIDKYKSNIDRFFQTERHYVHQKYAFDVMGEVKEKLLTEHLLHQINYEFQMALLKVCLDSKDLICRKHLILWALNVYDVDLACCESYKRDAGSTQEIMQIIKAMSELKLKTYHSLLSDTSHFTDIMISRDREFQSLLYKMGKEFEMSVGAKPADPK